MVQHRQQVRLVGPGPGDPLVQLIVTRHRGKQFVELLPQLRRPFRRGTLPVDEQFPVEIPVTLPKSFQPFPMRRHARRHALIMATVVNPAQGQFVGDQLELSGIVTY